MAVSLLITPPKKKKNKQTGILRDKQYFNHIQTKGNPPIVTIVISCYIVHKPFRENLC